VISIELLAGVFEESTITKGFKRRRWNSGG
jgi:hypothetical protein